MTAGLDTTNRGSIITQPESPSPYQEILTQYFGVEGLTTALPGYEDTNVRVTAANGSLYVLRVSPKGTDLETLAFVEQVMSATGSASFATPRAIATLSDERFARLPGGEVARLHGWVEGRTYAESSYPASAAKSIGRVAGEMVATLAPMKAVVVRDDHRWDMRYAIDTIKGLVGHISDPDRRHMIASVIRLLGEVRFDTLPRQVIHGDLNTGNLLLEGDDVVGVIDFGDARETLRIAELAIACAYAMLHQEDPVSVARDVFEGYKDFARPTRSEGASLFTLILGRLATSVCVAASLPSDNRHHHESAAAAWDLLARFTTADMDSISAEIAHASLGISPADAPARPLATARTVLGSSLGLSYDTPIAMVRGSGQYLFDDRGRRYLDCVNNVCHVGHSHPRVVEAAAAQMRVLNTNTRYLHANVLRYGERLVATLPDQLDTVFFVNSGSEANELAIRLARTLTARYDIACLEDGYHGNTSTLIEVSPYKFDGPGGLGRSRWVHVLPSPDPYRTGRFVGSGAAANYREAADEVLTSKAPAALIIEAMPGCGGQLVPADGVLAAAYDAARSQGGLVIADEIQTGMGRVGSAFWAFQLHDVDPDIVTIGKPAGNGHPLAAVVTTRDISNAFSNGMEYFNTFGGNPVSAAVGNAVLDVVEQQDLQHHASVVGDWLKDALSGLSGEHSAIGDVRGAGLFLGVELVKDRTTKIPDATLAHLVIEYALNDGVLLSVDGPHHNVIKIKPPLVFTTDNAERLVDVIDRALTELV